MGTRIREQKMLAVTPGYEELDFYLKEKGIKKVFLVCGRSIGCLKINSYFDTLFDRLGIRTIRFSNFQPNPLYDSVVEGVYLFRKEGCDAIIAIGGGSAMDVAKCIKLYSNMDTQKNYLCQKIVPNKVKLIAIPTTAGTGSEATKYAVIYYKGEKQSITDESCIPNAILLDSSTLETLPLYQKKATMLDAFCHALEAFWSVHSTEESREYSREAIKEILVGRKAYLANEKTGNERMMQAAHIAGKAINIAQTTAGHAMCYKLTSLYGIAHGHAAALCDMVLFPYMVENPGLCIDPRGRKHLSDIFLQIAEAMGCVGPAEAAEMLRTIVAELELDVPEASKEEFAELRLAVNQVRLKNHPIKLDERTIDMLYHEILKG